MVNKIQEKCPEISETVELPKCELNHSTENSRNSGSKVGWKENFREKIFLTLGYTSQGCPLFWKF